MATEAPAAVSTKDQVRALLDSGVTDAGEIAEKLGKTKATVYVHIRNIKTEAGEKPRGRGRPPKVQPKNGETPAESKSRPAPPKAGAKTEAPAKTEAKIEAKVSASNGHKAGERFPLIKSAIEQELSEKRKEVAMLERMLEATG